MPRVAIKTGTLGPDGNEIVLQEFLCDWPDCPNIAEQLLGVVCELRAVVIVCPEHAAMLQRRPRTDEPPR